jgi:hypothetical protein
VVVVPLFLGALLVAVLVPRRPSVPTHLRFAGQGVLALIAGSGLWNLVTDTAEILA